MARQKVFSVFYPGVYCVINIPPDFTPRSLSEKQRGVKVEMRRNSPAKVFAIEAWFIAKKIPGIMVFDHKNKKAITLEELEDYLTSFYGEKFEEIRELESDELYGHFGPG